MKASLAVDVDQLASDTLCSLDAVLPSQLQWNMADASLIPEKRLMLAVLEEAVFTFQRDAFAERPRGRDDFLEVQAWFAADHTEWPFSFVNICAALGFEPRFIRQGLAEWVRQRTALPAAQRQPLRNPFRRMNGSRHRPSGRAPKWSRADGGVAPVPERPAAA
jgi:hypothetical protein